MNISSHGLVITHEPRIRRTTCFVVGLCEHQTAGCKRELRECASEARLPMLLPAIWLDVFSDTRVFRSEGRVMGVRDIQLRTGMHWSVDFTDAKLTELDFNQLNYEWTVLGSELHWDLFALEFLLDAQAKLWRAHERFVAENSSSSACSAEKPGRRKSRDGVENRLENRRDLLVCLKARTDSLVRQVKVQLHSVSQ